MRWRGSFRLFAVWLFSAGFVLVGSGWGPALAQMVHSGPIWSVCGQALCECQPVDMPADCPLCMVGEAALDEAVRVCAGDEPGIDVTRLLIRRTNNEASMTRLDAAGQTLLVGCFILGLREAPGDAPAHARARVALVTWRMPVSMTGDVPTPPPRA